MEVCIIESMNYFGLQCKINEKLEVLEKRYDVIDIKLGMNDRYYYAMIIYKG